MTPGAVDAAVSSDVGVALPANGAAGNLGAADAVGVPINDGAGDVALDKVLGQLQGGGLADGVLADLSDLHGFVLLGLSWFVVVA